MSEINCYAPVILSNWSEIDSRLCGLVEEASELIADMTKNKATLEDLIKAIRYSNELIGLISNINEIREYYNIEILEKKYQCMKID